MDLTPEVERAGIEDHRLLRKLLPLEVRGKAKQKVEVAILDPNHDMRAKGTIQLTPFQAKNLRSRLEKVTADLSAVIERLDRENGLIP